MPAEPLDDIEPGQGSVHAAPWPLLDTIAAALQSGADRIATFRHALADGDASLKQRFADDEPVAVHYLPRDLPSAGLAGRRA